MIVFRRVLASLFAQPLGAARAATKGLLAFARVTRDALGLEDELFLVPVIVVDVGAIEVLDHLGGAGAGFNGLEDAEGDEGAATNLRLHRLARALLDHLCPTCALLPCHCLTCARLHRHYRAHALSLSSIRSWAAKQDVTRR